jgi:multimeric flavodoxin WrbA
MAEIYERWVSAHAVILLAPTYWYQSPSPLKLMIDRMVCADGGNPDPTTHHPRQACGGAATQMTQTKGSEACPTSNPPNPPWQHSPAQTTFRVTRTHT